MKIGMNFLVINTNSPKQTEELGEKLGKMLEPADVVCLIGELGAGKTAFTRGLGRGWGTTARVTSPTFTLINEYARPSDGRILYHLDCYRLTNDDDVETIGLEDILAADGAVVIEWPQVASSWLPDDRLSIEIEHVDEDGRAFNFSGSGERSKWLVKQVSDS